MDYTVQIAMKNKESYLQEMELYKQKKDEVVVTLIETQQYLIIIITQVLQQQFRFHSNL